jgi:EAL domain-containing protein (putative c-di-GMP-specific phosphodiesterase class I)
MDQSILNNFGLTALSASSDQMLMDAAKRALATPRGRFVLVLHLSRMRAPRSYHARIARSVLDQAAQRHAGMVFARSNADLLMLCHEPPGSDGAEQPAVLHAELSHLFGEEPTDSELISVWRLGTQANSFKAYLEQQGFAPPILPLVAEDVQPVHTASVAEWQRAASRLPMPELLGQQTAVIMQAGRDVPIGARLSPLFRELTVLSPGGPGGIDPWLERYVWSGLDSRLLAHLQQDLEDGGRLTRASVQAGLPLHINLSLASIVSPGFARVTQAARAVSAHLGVEISLLEAMADLPMLDYAAGLLRQAGIALVLEGLDEASLGFAGLAGLAPDFVKLDWSDGLAHGPAMRRRLIDARLQALGAGRVVLNRADTADSVAWGQASGINRFQGSFVDSVQGATRMFFCQTASLCTLRQCVARGGCAGTAGRAGCSNPAMLDLPPEAPPSADTVRGSLLLEGAAGNAEPVW